MKPHVLTKGPREKGNRKDNERIVDYLFPKTGKAGKERRGFIHLINGEEEATIKVSTPKGVKLEKVETPQG